MVDIKYIQRMQDLYGQWVELLPKLEETVKQWEEAEKIITELKAFYDDPKWIELYEMPAESIPLETNGNYSVLSQDALWNAFSDQYSLVEELKIIQAKLEPETD